MTDNVTKITEKDERVVELEALEEILHHQRLEEERLAHERRLIEDKEKRLWPWTLLAVLLCLLAIFAMGSPLYAEESEKDYWLVIENLTSSPVTEFYWSPIDKPGWSDDVLAHRDLYSGSHYSVELLDGRGSCVFDFKISFADDEDLYFNDFDVCMYEILELTDE